MSQRGYIGCIGCGRMFKEDVPEQAAMLAHSCEDSDEKINLLIDSYRAMQERNGVSHVALQTETERD